jgi:transposase
VYQTKHYVRNKLPQVAVLGQANKYVVISLKRSLRPLKKEIATIEEKLLELVNEVHKDILTRLKSILEIGKKTSLILVVLTDGFDRFTSGSEFCSYKGLPPYN